MTAKAIKFFLVSIVLLTASFGFSQCPPISDNASLNSNNKPSGWAQSVTVQVYIDSSQYTSDQVNGLKQAFINWQSSPAYSNVTYDFVVSAGPPAPTGRYVVIKNEMPTPDGTTADPTAAAYTSWNTSLNAAGTRNVVNNATIQINPGETVPAALTEVVAHEIGHLNFLGECIGCALGSSVMAFGDVMNGTSGSMSPTSCDTTKSSQVSLYPDPYQSGGDGGGLCPEANCELCYGFGCFSPILVDIEGSGFRLTSFAAGVDFDLNADGFPEHLSWTDQSFRIAFLALDRNANGTIDDGTELFGNFTPQPPSPEPNGFMALAVFDGQAWGGNGDGNIDGADNVFSSLLLWIDENHDGISQPGELHNLSELGVNSISLNYMESWRRDRFGNEFRFKAKVNSRARNDHSQVGPWAVDVFLLNH